MSSLLCRLTAVQAACRPTHTTGHVAGLPAGREAARPGSTAGSSSGEVNSPLCNAATAASAALSCTLAGPPLNCLSALQSNSLTQQHCIGIASQFAVVQCTQCLPMHSAMHSNRLKPASTQLRPHSALHHTCIALHTLAHDTALTPTLHRNAPRCNSLSACVCSGGHCTRACGSVAGVGGVRGRGWV